MSQGLDCASSTLGKAACIKAAGYSFVCRYYPSYFPKSLTWPEARALKAAGLYIVSVFETSGDHAAYFSYTKGKSDGAAALQAAIRCHQPEGSPIYFAADFDAQASDLPALRDYFMGVRTVVMPTHLIGVYGSGLVCETIKGAGLAHYSWLAMSTGWTGSAEYTDWDVKQTVEKSVCGLNVDEDESTGHGGGWMPT